MGLPTPPDIPALVEKQKHTQQRSKSRGLGNQNLGRPLCFPTDTQHPPCRVPTENTHGTHLVVFPPMDTHGTTLPCSHQGRTGDPPRHLTLASTHRHHTQKQNDNFPHLKRLIKLEILKQQESQLNQALMGYAGSSQPLLNCLPLTRDWVGAPNPGVTVIKTVREWTRLQKGALSLAFPSHWL